MPNLGDVVFVTGPMGSGKSTLAHYYMARQLGWVSVSDDTYWVENGWGSGLRSPNRRRWSSARSLTAC